MALIDSIISYWKFNESSGNAADSHGSNTLTNNNTIVYSAGQISNGADLESSSSQVFSITDAAQTGLDIGGTMSISMWLKPESITGTHGLVTKFADVAPLKQYRLSFDTTDVAWVISNNGTAESQALWTSPLSTGTWQHLVLVYDASAGEATLYHNGSAVSTQTGLVTSIANTTSVFRIGSRSSSSDTAQQYYDGMIDEVGIWGKVLTSGEVSQLYNSGSGLTYPFSNAYTLSIDTGTYTYTGYAVTLSKTSTGWNPETKNSSTFAAATRSSSTFAPVSKNSSTFTSQSKS